MRKLAIAALTAALPTFAAAEGFTIADLGSVPDDPSCLSRGETMFQAFARSNPVGQIKRGSANWSVLAFDVTSDDYDMILICTYGPNDQVRVTLVVYSSDRGENPVRDQLAKDMRAIWDRNK